MTAPTIGHTWDGHLQTPCPSWCWHGCDGTLHGSDAVSVHVKRHAFPLTINIVHPATEAEAYISLVDAHNRREDQFTADEAEHLANILLNHTKILRAHAQEVSA